MSSILSTTKMLEAIKIVPKFLRKNIAVTTIYRVSPIIRPTRKIRPSVIFEDDFNVSPTLKIRVSNRTWTRTVNPNEPFHFGEPEPNLNQQNFTSVNLNQTWTLKIVLKWTQTEPEPLTKVRINFSISGCRWCRYTHNKSSGDHQQDQQFLLFFSGRNE